MQHKFQSTCPRCVSDNEQIDLLSSKLDAHRQLDQSLKVAPTIFMTRVTRFDPTNLDKPYVWFGNCRRHHVKLICNDTTVGNSSVVLDFGDGHPLLSTPSFPLHQFRGNCKCCESMVSPSRISLTQWHGTALNGHVVNVYCETIAERAALVQEFYDSLDQKLGGTDQ